MVIIREIAGVVIRADLLAISATMQIVARAIDLSGIAANEHGDRQRGFYVTVSSDDFVPFFANYRRSSPLPLAG